MQCNSIQFQERLSAVKGLRSVQYELNCGFIMIKIQLNSNNECHKKQSLNEVLAD